MQAKLEANDVLAFAEVRNGSQRFEICNFGTDDGRGALLSLCRDGDEELLQLQLRPGDAAVVKIGPGRWNVVNLSTPTEPQPATLLWRALRN